MAGTPGLARFLLFHPPFLFPLFLGFLFDNRILGHLENRLETVTHPFPRRLAGYLWRWHSLHVFILLFYSLREMLLIGGHSLSITSSPVLKSSNRVFSSTNGPPPRIKAV